MSFMTNEIIRRKKKKYIYIYIYIYIYGYLINYEYFNNLNGEGYYSGDMYIPIPNWKSRGFLIPIPSQCGNFPSKRGQVRAIPTEANLFAISSGYAEYYNKYSSHFFCTEMKNW